jgi:pimeloyl-ACP methyl ester carboxylesterase
MAMRQFGDVIALDQRGTGASADVPRCVSSVKAPDDQAVSDAEYAEVYRRSAEECVRKWRADGVDFTGYTTSESADDIDALRAALGAEKVTLWGISYGTHLAMAAAKQVGGRIDRMVLASAEGLDQTVKLPARTDEYFGRLQAVIDADPEAKAMFPDIKALMRRVHAKLEAEPVRMDLPAEAGPTPFLLTRRDMQMMASAMIADPENAAMLMQLYLAADHGVYEPVAGVLARFGAPNEPISWSVMSLVMDVASGIDDDRLALVKEQAKTSLLGDYLNFPMPHLKGALGGLDLGEEFREKPVSDVPTLLFSATLDGRTYPESQHEALSGMSDLTVVTVVNAGHNLFMTSPEVTQTIEAFMRGEAVTKTEIVVPPPSFARN